MFYQGVYDDYIMNYYLGSINIAEPFFLLESFLRKRTNIAPTYISSKDSDKNVKQRVNNNCFQYLSKSIDQYDTINIESLSVEWIAMLLHRYLRM